MDLASENKFNFKVLNKVVNVIGLAPGLWSIYYFSFVKPGSLDAFIFYRDKFYTYFAVSAILLAFMIMFRRRNSAPIDSSVKSNNQGIIQMLIPGMVLGIILVTFSYAIAGIIRVLLNLQ